MPFFVTVTQVGLLLLYAVPGYLFVRFRFLDADRHILPISKILVYVCQPCLEVYAFCSAKRTPSLLAEMGWFFLLCTVLQAVLMGALFLVLRKRKNAFEDVRARVCAFAAAFGNVGFFGIPLLEALLPESVAADAVALSAVFAVSMNWLAWTVGLRMISGDPKRVRVRAVLLNPATLALAVALPLFLTGFQLPDAVGNAVGLCGKMATPLCMIVLGMRLAATKWKQIFSDPFAWLASAGKLLVLPALAFLLCLFLPLPDYFKAALFLLCCCPTASAVQNFSEISLSESEGKATAANSVLLSNLLCVLTIPLLALLIHV